MCNDSVTISILHTCKLFTDYKLLKLNLACQLCTSTYAVIQTSGVIGPKSSTLLKPQALTAPWGGEGTFHHLPEVGGYIYGKTILLLFWDGGPVFITSYIQIKFGVY